MAKQLNVNLAFSADTSKVKAQLQDLQNQLNRLTLSSKTELGITKDIEEASRAAAELSVHLKNATNQQTGTLDFSKLNQSIKKSGTSLQQYGRTLQSLGPQGQQAFMSLAQAVANSEVPIRRTNAMLREMGTTLANTARWQLSSSMLHGFMGAVQSAYGYAQDLNESLNNIRIVTGQNIDEMAKFAEEANKAARALSTTTTEYTNASLIYYQQGLNDQQVKERTDITIKMANVARQSAEVVSDQMTAVWNNFYDGSKSLEHYADVMTALGAATASSTDEISEGLNKFAAIANTVGLSYEYAASALATVTATTRQSADVVGTAFKTLFARIQDLELGKTLDDGTTLGSYSQALAKVGVQIKDTSGEMKSMDTILEEMAAKWETLGKAEQIALAQSVAGVRQYTQLIALMDNWDFMKQNLATSNASSGALQKQADIYAESWEAAADRVTAAAENIYKALINDEFFIDLLNGVEKVITFVDHLIDNLGGLKGVLTAIGAIVTKVFANQISQGLTNITYNLKMMTEKGRQAEKDARKKFIDDAVESVPQSKEYTTDIEKAQQQSMRSQLELQQQYMENADRMNAVEAEVNKKMMDRVSILRQQVVEAERKKEIANKAVDENEYDILTDVAAFNIANPDSQIDEKPIHEYIASIKKAAEYQDILASSGTKAYQILTTEPDKASAAMQELSKALDAVAIDAKDLGDEGVKAFQSLKTALNNVKNAKTPEELEKAIEELNRELEILSKNSGIQLKDVVSPGTTKKVDALTESLQKKIKAQRESAESAEQARQAELKASESIKKATGAQKGWSDMLVESANLAFSVASAFQMLSSAWDTIKDPDVSGWDKFLSIMMTLGMVIPTFISIYKTLKSVISLETVAKIANAAATMAQTAAEQSYGQVKGQNNIKIKQSTKETWKDTWNKLKNKGQNIKDTWNQKAFEAQGGTIHKNGTSSIKGRSGIISKAETSQLTSQAGKQALKNLGTKVGGAAIIVAAVAAATMIAKAAIDHYNRFETAAKKAEETANAMKATYETVASAEQEFRSNLDTYASGVDSLENLTKGTEEYKDAVRNANNEAIKLLNTYKNLKYEINDEGLIVIDETDLLNAKRESLEKETKASIAAMQAQQDADNARLKADKVNFQRTQMKTGGVHWDDDDTTAVAGGVGAGAALAGGAVAYTAIAASNVWNPVGWAMLIAGAVAAVIGVGIAAFNNDADAREAQTLNALEEFSINNGGRDLTKEEIKAIADQQDSSGKLAESLLKDVDATNNMIAEMRANAEAINRNNELIANQLLQNNDYVMGSEYSEEIVERSGLFYGQAYKEALAMVESSGWGKTGISKATGVNAEAKEIWSDYLTYAGLEDKGWQLVDTTGTDENRIFVYLDEQGQRQEKTLVEMQKMYAAYIASSKTDINATQLVGYFKEWSEKQGAVDQGIAAFLMNGNFEDATKNEAEAIQNEIATKYQGDTQAYLEAKLGDLSVVAEKLGYDNADALVNAFSSGLTNIDKAWNDIDFNGMSEEISKNVKISTAQSLENTVKLMNAGQLGEEAGIMFTEGLNNLLANVKPEDQEEALSRIAEIDWTQWDAAEQIVTIMRNLGYEVDTTPAEWENFVTQMNIANGAVFDHAQALKDIAKMTELVNDLSIGDIISKEDYNMLVQYNDEVERYFRILGDGTYKVIGDPLDLIQEIGKGIDKSYADAVTGAETNYKNIQFRAGVDSNVKATGYSRDQLSSTSVGVVDTKTTTVQNDPNAGHYILGFLTSVAQGMSGNGSYGAVHVDSPQANAQMYAGTTTSTTNIEGIKDVDLYGAQIDFIDQYLTSYTDEQIQIWRDAANDPRSQKAKDAAAEVSEIVADYLEMYPTVVSGELDTAEKAVQDAKDKQFSAELDYAATAQTAEQLDAMYEKNQIGDKAYNSAQLEFVQQEKWEGMDPNEVGEYADALMDAAKSSELLYDNMSQETAEDVALYTKKMNEGIKKLQEGFEDWNSILDKSDKGSEEYTEAMNNMKDAMSDVLGVNEDFISDKFILENLSLIEKAAEGSAEAIDDLAAALGQEIIYDITIDGSQAEKDALQAHADLQTKLSGKEVGFSVTADMDTDGIITGAQQVIDSAQMTVSEAQAYFNSLGYEPVFETKEEPVEQRVPITITQSRIIEESDDGKTWKTATSSYQDGYDTFTGKMDVVAMSSDGKTPKIKELRKKSSGAMNNFSSSNAGGKSGGGSSKKASPTKKSDVVERYKEINDKISDSEKAMDDASKAADRLWGPARVKAIQDANAALETNIALLKDKRAEAEYNLQTDKKALENTILKNAGISITDAMFDQNGNFIAYNEILNGLYDELNQAETEAGPEWSDKEQEKIDGINDRISAVKEAIADYDATNSLIKEFDTKIKDGIYEWQDNNYEELNIALEYKLEINEGSMKRIDYYLNKITDDIHATAEAFAYLSQQTSLYENNLLNQNQYVNDLTAAYTNGEISLQAYKEGLATAQNAVISNLESLDQQKKAMQEYYGNVIDMALDKIALYTDEMEYLNSVLDHYSNITELIGKQDDYATKDTILRTKADNLQRELQTQKELYEKFSLEAQKWESQMATAIEGSNEYETYKQNWQAAQEAANNAQDAMLSKTEEWAEAMKAIVENELAEMSDILEKSFTGGISFDELMTSMERRNSLQEEYLTTTNKIYETNKLMRTAQQAIDKTSNTVAKRRLQNFIKETNQLQSQTKLSQYELEIQQAKYDLLLAEIALEEAQRAKTTVRLARNDEGQFGYIYTADQNQINDAEQTLADALNSLYNIGLEGANEYQQKYAETLQESQDAITELTQMWMNGEISSEEEFNRRKQEITEYYGEKLQQYSELHTIALSADSRVLTEAWSSDFIERTVSVEMWRDKVDEYFESAADSMQTWAQVCSQTLKNSDLDKWDEAIKKVDDRSKALVKTLIGEDGKSGVVGAMLSEVNTAGQVSAAHITIQNSIDTTISKYEALLNAIQLAHAEMTKEVKPKIDTSGGSYTPDSSYKTTDNTGNKGSTGNTGGTGGNTGSKGDTGSTKDTTLDPYYYSVKDKKVTGRSYAFAEIEASSVSTSKWRVLGNYLVEQTNNPNQERAVKVADYLAAMGLASLPNFAPLNTASSLLPFRLPGFDTGGYTGDWSGSYGKLAMLHKKELILKEGDTENFLASMELLERILSIIDLQSANAQLGGMLSSPSYGNHATETIVEQNVHIEASFPGVSDRNELQEAFTNLINQASQYANRK